MSSLMTPVHPPRTAPVVVIATWGIVTTTVLLVSAIVRLTPLALEPLSSGAMTGFQWTLYIGWALFNGYVEGYRGFQNGYVPRVVARAFWLGQHPRPLFVLLAPFFCSGLFHATRKRLIISWAWCSASSASCSWCACSISRGAASSTRAWSSASATAASRAGRRLRAGAAGAPLR